MATIHSPVPGYTGPGPGGVRLVDGRGETDDPRVIAYARRHGYRIETTPVPAPPRRPRQRKE
ncbi:hypothetical protein [Streptomyces cacaoi]|uniref:hypothetical protein n=1 Tax=Streptomyces cacaoi TaxID=1898 RepID=UPI0037481DCB